METTNNPADVSPYRVYLRVGYVLVVLIIAACCVEFVRNLGEPTDRDFISFWGAARLALAGTPSLAYDNAALHAVQVKAATFDGGEMPFPYSPAFLLLVMPFATLPFPWAMILWSCATLGSYAAVARTFAPKSGWLALAFPPVFVNASIGQTGFLVAAVFLGGLALLADGRRFAAGLLLGCLVLKPQMALMLPIALLWGREWRVIAGGMLSATAVLLAGLLVFGHGASLAWLHQMAFYAEATRNGSMGWHKLVSLYAAARQAGLSEPLALTLHGIVALAAAALVAHTWRSKATPTAKAGVLGAATLLASPYIYLYDSFVLIPAFVLLVQTRAPVTLVGALWLMPIMVIAQTAYETGAINLGPLLPIVLLVSCWLRSRERRDGSTLGAATGRRLQLIWALLLQVRRGTIGTPSDPLGRACPLD